MIGLGELEQRATDFADHNIRVFAISIDRAEDAAWVGEQCPSLTVIPDPESQLIDAFDVKHPHSSPTGDDTAAPTTILIDQEGLVRWVHRPADLFTRYPTHELLESVSKALALE